MTRPMARALCLGGIDRHARTSTDADDRQAVWVASEVVVGSLVRSGTADSEQPGCFGDRENLRRRVSRNGGRCVGLCACLGIRRSELPSADRFSRESPNSIGRNGRGSVKAVAAKPCPRSAWTCGTSWAGTLRGPSVGGPGRHRPTGRHVVTFSYVGSPTCQC